MISYQVAGRKIDRDDELSIDKTHKRNHRHYTNYAIIMVCTLINNADIHRITTIMYFSPSNQ
jgi:hypothetical protein